jgi:peroxiredoxin
MARTPSNMLTLGTKAPEFNLFNTVDGSHVRLQDANGTNGTVILFICNHCPFVVHVNDELISIANHYTNKGIGFIAISSNDINTHPQDGPIEMGAHARRVGYPFPYLYDETQEVAKAFNAACTPDLYVFNENLELVYRGQLDDSRPGNGITLTGKDLRHAINCLLDGTENMAVQKPSIGCNIKWKI